VPHGGVYGMINLDKSACVNRPRNSWITGNPEVERKLADGPSVREGA